MAEPIGHLDPERVRGRLDHVRARIAAAADRVGRDPDGVEICVATKYVAPEAMPALVEAGVTLVGENRQQDLAVKAEFAGDRLTFDFIGHLQSRKVKLVLPHVRLVHSVASDSVLEQLERHGTPATEILVEVNLSGEPAKSGIPSDGLEDFLSRSPVTVAGLMTMPPQTEDPEASRPYFRQLRELAERHGLARLSMGTTQDFETAVEEGATIVRVGTILFR